MKTQKTKPTSLFEDIKDETISKRNLNRNIKKKKMETERNNYHRINGLEFTNTLNNTI